MYCIIVSSLCCSDTLLQVAAATACLLALGLLPYRTLQAEATAYLCRPLDLDQLGRVKFSLDWPSLDSETETLVNRIYRSCLVRQDVRQRTVCAQLKLKTGMQRLHGTFIMQQYVRIRTGQVLELSEAQHQRTAAIICKIAAPLQHEVMPLRFAHRGWSLL